MPLPSAMSPEGTTRKRRLSWIRLRCQALILPHRLAWIAKKVKDDPVLKEELVQLALRKLPRAIRRGSVGKTQQLVEVLHVLQPLGPAGAKALNELVPDVARQDFVVNVLDYYVRDRLGPSLAAHEFAAHALRLSDLTTQNVAICFQVVTSLAAFYVYETSTYEVARWCLEHPNADAAVRRLLLKPHPQPEFHKILANDPAARNDPLIVHDIFEKGLSPEAMATVGQSLTPGQAQTLINAFAGNIPALGRLLEHLGPRIHLLPKPALTTLLQHPDKNIRLRTIMAMGMPSDRDPSPGEETLARPNRMPVLVSPAQGPSEELQQPIVTRSSSSEPAFHR